MNCKHDLTNKKVIRSRSFIIERGKCAKCGAIGQYTTTGAQKNGKYEERRKWEKLDG